MHSESEFYVGYLPMPAGLKKTIRRVAVALGALAMATAAILVAGQHPFPAAYFEFQQYREFRGTLIAEPYPALAIPGEGLPWLLVAPGKHGVGDMRAFDGREVKLTGERIIHGDDHMIEMPGQASSLSAPAAQRVPDADLGEVELTGEVVDSKCYFGVMNPGAGKVHRDCAVRCISGGIPPAFLVRDSNGNTMTLLLANWNRSLLQHVAEPVTIRGRLVRSSGRLTLYQE
ncbi:MAG TPA: hypothetical protein VMH81_33340 [Bryobacteraceae bacterium]|nr:hypothetical protein [Bryobacteraceae bacterium]